MTVAQDMGVFVDEEKHRRIQLDLLAEHLLQQPAVCFGSEGEAKEGLSLRSLWDRSDSDRKKCVGLYLPCTVAYWAQYASSS